MNFEDIVTLLIGTAEAKAKPSGLIEACRKFNMKEIEYLNIGGDPLYNVGHWFIFNTPSGEEAKLEIIQTDIKLREAIEDKKKYIQYPVDVYNNRKAGVTYEQMISPDQEIKILCRISHCIR